MLTLILSALALPPVPPHDPPAAPACVTRSRPPADVCPCGPAPLGSCACRLAETAKAEPPPAPAVYRLADVSGQVWTHSDPQWLSAYVGRVNARLQTPPPGPVYYQAPAVRYSAPYGSSCAGGSCGRRR